MNLDFSTSTLNRLSVHEVGNKQNGGQLYASADEIPLTTDLVDLLNHYFLKPFTLSEYWNFTSNHQNLLQNPVYGFVHELFSTPDSFHFQTIQIAKQLFESGNHPKIKNGDLFVAYFSHVVCGTHICDAIGIFKSEQKDSFIKANRKGKTFLLNVDEGINIDKLDKGCLILNIDSDLGYKVAIIDKAGRGSEANYWKDDFLMVKPVADAYSFTKNFLNITQAYVTKQLSEEFEVTKADQIDLLNKSVKYFKENERFEEGDFMQEVFEDKLVIDSFNSFKSTMQQETDLDVAAGFDINLQAVKKQAKVFKSVLKLDRNFHVYIHGNRNLIERGEDDNGRKFYKLYYEQEE